MSTADGELEILRGIDFEVPSGASAAIVGASGSGKSTLLGLLAGMDVASSGKIWLDGECLSDLDEDQRAACALKRWGLYSKAFNCCLPDSA